MIQGPLQWGILAEPSVIENCWLILPDTPGPGVDLADALETQFPYIEDHYAVEVTR